MPSPQYNPRRQHREPPKKIKRSGASSTGRNDGARVNIPWWLWIVLGIALGVFVSFLVRLTQTAPPATAAVDIPKVSGKKIPEKNAKSSAEQNASKSFATLDDKNAKTGDAAKIVDDKNAQPDETKTVTKFDFYTLLPEREVILPSDREALKAVAKPKVIAGQQQNAAVETEQLFLQAGSFRSAQEAERRRAQIKALGLDAKVEGVTASADTWYRVQAGPFTSREQLSKARDQLSAAGIESLLLRQK
jgi:cell division protein FtsN